MRIFHGLPTAAARRDCALTIGNFDGVHRGHQALLARLRAGAQARGLAAVACTFEPHPREYFAAAAARRGERRGAGRAAAEPPARIATLRDKIEALAACGVDAVCVLRFDAALAAMDAEAFVSRVLAGGLGARHLLVGDDFRFGAHRAGDFALLAALAPRLGYSLERMDTFTGAGAGGQPSERVSSSALRAALAAGDLARAALLLGRPYSIRGRVLHGRKLGRTLGFPTLNQRLWRAGAHALARPALAGVFAVRVHGLPGAGGPRDGVASLGTRPAVERDGAWLLETHLFDWSGDLYGRCLRIEFVAKLRDEAHYDTLEALTLQIALDARDARRALAAAPASTRIPTR